MYNDKLLELENINQKKEEEQEKQKKNVALSI